MGVRKSHEDPIARHAGDGGDAGNDLIDVLVGEQNVVELDPHDALCWIGDRRRRRFEEEYIRQEGTVDPRGSIVPGSTPHTVVDPDGWGDVPLRVSEPQDRSWRRGPCRRHRRKIRNRRGRDNHSRTKGADELPSSRLSTFSVSHQ